MKGAAPPSPAGGATPSSGQASLRFRLSGQACPTRHESHQVPSVVPRVEVIQPVNYGVHLDPGLNGPLICLGHGHVREVNAGGLPAPLCQINRIRPHSMPRSMAKPGFRARTASMSNRLASRLNGVLGSLNFAFQKSRSPGSIS
jgi:hypothetical protein